MTTSKCKVTIKDISRPVEFEVVNMGEMPTANGRRRWAFSGRISLNRKDYDLKWNPFMEPGDLLAGDEANGIIEIQLVQEKAGCLVIGSLVKQSRPDSGWIVLSFYGGTGPHLTDFDLLC